MCVRRSVGLIPLPNRDLGRAESWSPWTKSLPGKCTDMHRNGMRGHSLPCSNINIVDTAFQWYTRGRTGPSWPILQPPVPMGWGQLLCCWRFGVAKASQQQTSLCPDIKSNSKEQIDAFASYFWHNHFMQYLEILTMYLQTPIAHSCWTHPCFCRRPGFEGAVFYLLHPTTWWCRTIRYISLCVSEQHTTDPKLPSSALNRNA